LPWLLSHILVKNGSEFLGERSRKGGFTFDAKNFTHPTKPLPGGFFLVRVIIVVGKMLAKIAGRALAMTAL
jgi:hypothetical protein